MSIASHNRTPPILVSASRVRPLRPFFRLVFGSAGPAIVLCPIIIFLFSTSSISTSSWIANGSRPGGRANRSGRREAETTGEGKTSVRSVQGRKSLGRRTGWALLGWSSRSARERDEASGRRKYGIISRLRARRKRSLCPASVSVLLKVVRCRRHRPLYCLSAPLPFLSEAVTVR